MSKELPRLFALDMETVSGVFPPTGKNANFFIVNHMMDEEIIRAHAEKVVEFHSKKLAFGGKHAELWKKEFELTFKEKSEDVSNLIAYEKISDLAEEVVQWFLNDKTAEGCLIYDDREAYEDVIGIILQHVD